MADGEKTIDLPKAAEKLADAQEELKVTHAAMQACAKAWDVIEGPGDGKRAMWAALGHSRAAFQFACRREARAFGVLNTVVGQGDLFNGGEGDGSGTGAGGPVEPGPGSGPSTALARRPGAKEPKPRTRKPRKPKDEGPRPSAH